MIWSTPPAASRRRRLARTAAPCQWRYQSVAHVGLTRFSTSGRTAKTGSHAGLPSNGVTTSHATPAATRPSWSERVWVWTPVEPCSRLTVAMTTVAAARRRGVGAATADRGGQQVAVPADHRLGRAVPLLGQPGQHVQQVGVLQRHDVAGRQRRVVGRVGVQRPAGVGRRPPVHVVADLQLVVGGVGGGQAVDPAVLPVERRQRRRAAPQVPRGEVAVDDRRPHGAPGQRRDHAARPPAPGRSPRLQPRQQRRGRTRSARPGGRGRPAGGRGTCGGRRSAWPGRPGPRPGFARGSTARRPRPRPAAGARRRPRPAWSPAPPARPPPAATAASPAGARPAWRSRRPTRPAGPGPPTPCGCGPAPGPRPRGTAAGRRSWTAPRPTAAPAAAAAAGRS